MTISIVRTILGSAAIIAIASPAIAGAPRNPTYTKDVAPILIENCVKCHQPDQIGPMSLRTYEEVRPWAKSIAENVAGKVMPPWHADPGYGPFRNERTLTDDEIATIVRWVDQGAKQGNPKDMPEIPVLHEDGWRLGEPDYVIEFDEVEVPGGGPDQFHDLTAKTDLPEDKWIKGIEIRPGNRQVVHHVILWQEDREFGGNGAPQGWIGAWAAGAVPEVFPEGTGRILRKGTTLIGDMHYHPTDKTVKDVTRVGLHFADDEDVEKELINQWVINTDFEIPPGDPNYEAHAAFTFPQDGIIHSLAPHMHYRGKDFTYTLTYPDGKTDEVLKVSKYDFNWQTDYELENPIEVPEGTRVDCIAHWDNSADNPANPDPTKTVRFGNESYDEMMIGFIDWTVKDGVRPVEKPNPIVAKLDELKNQYPGEVFAVRIPNLSAVHIPREGEGGWYIDIGGFVGKARLYEIAWDGDAFTSKMAIPGEDVRDLSGEIEDSGETLSLKMTMPNGQAMPVRGVLAR